MQFHANLVRALQHPSTWAGFAGVMSSIASQLTPPYSPIFYSVSAAFSFIAILITPPGEDKSC